MPKPDYETTVGERRSLTDRPSELAAALALLPTAYGAFTAIHIPQLAAGVLALVVALVPWLVSTIRDGFRDADDPGDNEPTDLPPVKRGKHEKVGLNHEGGAL